MLRLWKKQKMADVQISARDLVLAALYVAGEVDYRRRLHCAVYWIVEELEDALRNPSAVASQGGGLDPPTSFRTSMDSTASTWPMRWRR